MSNIIQVVFSAVADNLKAVSDTVKEKISATADSMKESMGKADAAVATASANIEKSMAQAEKSLAKAGATARNSVKEMSDLSKIDAIMEGTIKSFAELAAADAALERMMKSGMISTTEYLEAQAAQIVVSEMLEKQTLQEAAAQAVNTAGKKAATVSSRELSRSISSIAVQGATGQVQGMSTQVASLAGRFAMAGGAASLAVAGIAAVIAVIGTLLFGLIAGTNETIKFNQAIGASGNYANTSASEMHTLATAVAGGSVTISEASTAIAKMVTSGKLNNEQMQRGAMLAADFARITGQSMESAADSVIALGENPLQAIKKLDGQMHLLTLQQYDYVKELERTEGQAAATDYAINTMADASAIRAKDMAEHAGWVERAWNGVKNAVNGAKNAIMDIGRVKGEIESIQSKLSSMRETNARAAARSFPQAYSDGEIAALEKQLAAVTTKTAADAKAADAKAAQTKAAKEAIDLIDKEHLSLDESAAKQERLNDLQRAYMALRKENPNDKRLEGVDFASDGKPMGGGQFGADMSAMYASDAPKKPKGGDGKAEERAAARAAHREQMEAQREEMTQLQIKRDATLDAGNERLAIDEQIVARAMALYGKDSNEYRSALNQQRADKEAQLQQMQQLAEIRLSLERTLADSERSERAKYADDDYASGRINASQLAAVHAQLITEKLAQEQRYYETKKAMAEAAGDTVGAAQADAAIAVAQNDALIAQRSNNDEWRANEVAAWQGFGDTIAGSLGSSVNGMIFQGQRLRDSFKNMIGQMLQSFIGFCTQKLAKYITTTTAEVAANIAGNTAKVASDKVAAKESIMANAGAAIKKIIANAAEVFTSVYKAIAGIPYVGPFLAPVMAVAAGATVIGMVSKVASAEGGWERVPSDGVITELHKDEQVLPAEYAEGLRNLVGGEGGGGQPVFNVTISAMDGRSVERWARSNAPALAAGLQGHVGNMRPA